MNDFNIILSNTADDDFFGSLKGSQSSKLQQLFVDDALSPDDKDKSLKYERPKDISTTSNNTNTTLVAKVVTAYQQGELQGKVGMALVQNTYGICSIIMYKAKAHILTTLKLNPGQELLYKQKNYWQFYDGTSGYWSFSFDKNSDEKEFVEKLHIKNITITENIIITENNESATVSESHFDLSNFDSEVHSIENEHYRNKPPIKETKNSLVKRMAKMGRPLPTLSSKHQKTTEFSDSSDTEVIQTPLTSSQNLSITPRSNKITTGQSIQQLVPSIVGLSSVASSVFPINPVESQYMQMLLTEQRTQSSEIRMNMNKLENKIEEVLDKLEFCDKNDGKQKIEKDDEILELEEKLLMLKKENRKLKQNIQQNTSQQSKENQLQDFVTEFKDDFKTFNIDYNQGVKNILFQLCNKLKDHNDVIEQMENKIKDNESKLDKLTWEMELNLKQNSKLKHEISLLNQRENELKTQLNEKEAEALKQKQDILDLQNKLLEKNKVSLENPNDALIKSIMNNLFLDIANKLDNASFRDSEEILSLIATSIKQQTLTSLQKCIKK